MSSGATTPMTTSESGAADASPAMKEMPTFTEREDTVMKIAWQCLKSGPPEIDIAKLTELGGFNTQKTASNTWGGIKKKLMSMAPPIPASTGDGDATPKPKATPKPTPKKRTKKAGADEDDEEANTTASPAKKSRATPAKKSAAAAKKEKQAKLEVKVKDEEAEDEEMGE